MKLNASTVITTARPGMSSQGASATDRKFCASCRSTPQLMAGGRRPSPRKDSDVSEGSCWGWMG